MKPHPASTIAAWLLQSVEVHPDLMGPVPIPSHFADVTVEGIARPVLRECLLRYGEHFWEEASVGVAPLFLGRTGVYKSYAAAVLAKALHSRACVHVAWCTVPVDLTQLERNRFATDTSEQIERWKQVPFLVMDDFAMVVQESWQYSVLLEVTMARFEAGRPTCWTGNLELEGTPTADAVDRALRAAVGMQLSRRMMERSEGYRVYVR